MSTERPGVYTTYEVSGVVRGSDSGGAVGLAAASETGESGTVVEITDYAAALREFGEGNLSALVKVLLANGAPVVHCCAVSGTDYASAFSALMGVREIRYMVCDSRDAAIHAALLDAINGADEESKYRIGVVESGESDRASLISAAAALNSERMVLVSHHETDGTAGAVAAAVCGVMAGEDDPALPLNGATLNGLGEIAENFSDSDLTLLVRGGVTPLETLGGAVTVVRGITTRTTSGGAADATWREVNTVLIVDEVLPGIRDTLRAAFARVKNTAQTRGAIRTRVMIELENYVAKEIIDSYESVTVTADADDATICTVSFGFAVAHGLNIINLSAQIAV
ncbi:MAG: phage tail sheath subtilisin-like domain-containing protein [Oscillospiraceae bacterium]|nr:phage tail sheath subtilisin-like domain-containing protein [Oscillospiraceae bacterium]